MERVCLLLHNLIPGGSGRQWVHLLGMHVAAGGKATIVAPPGLLAVPARAAGIELFEVDWEQGVPQGNDALWHLVGGHDVAIVHWDHLVMEAFAPALAAAGRAALVVHQAPGALSRWLGPDIHASIRRPLARAASSPKAVVLVRGKAHRERFASAFDLPVTAFELLPASIPITDIAFQPTGNELVEMLALTRLSPEKAPIVQLAVELAATRLSAGERCRLTIAGAGPWLAEAHAICARSLPSGGWRFEGPPADPIGRLAAADLIVAQGLTTLEAAALGRRVVIAREIDAHSAGGAVLTPDNYETAARDPFGFPALSDGPGRIWEEVAALRSQDLASIRALTERHNSLESTSRALAAALKKTA